MLRVSTLVEDDQTPRFLRRRGRFARAEVPPAPRTYAWSRQDSIFTAIIALAAFVTRFVGLTSATATGTPVFDEKHYVPQAWDMVESWMNPILGGIESNPGYGLVVHPPLAKQIEALGEMVFGYTPLGWRVMAALFGVAVVLLTMDLVRRLTHSPYAALFAGVLATCDGVLLVGSRFGMLDIFQVLFIVAAAWALVLDHQQMQRRMHEAYVSGLIMGDLGPRLGFRWWRFALGLFLGCALSVKWSGLYYIAFFGLLSVALDAWLRHQYRLRRPLLGALRFDAFPAFASLVLLPAALYVWSWRAWFASETSVYRHAATDGTIPEGSALRILPDTLASWLYYHQTVLKFHESLTTSSGHTHPWDSKPWAWLVSARPILYYSSTDISCGETTCRRMIFLFGTPAIWWLTVPVLLWAAWAMVIRREGAYLVPFVAFMAGFVPWLASYDRQMYFFYATALVPFTIVMLSLVMHSLWGRGRLVGNAKIQELAPGFRAGHLAVVCYLALVIAMFAYFSPILYGYEIPDAYYNSIMWFRSWQ